MKIYVSPTGKVVRGHVLDMNPKFIEAEMKKMDSRLYLNWNPKKFDGYGKWDIRIRPLHKSVVQSFLLDGATYSRLEYVEYDIENCIFDTFVLDLRVLNHLKRIDTWENPENLRDLDYKFRKYQVEQEEKFRADMTYQLKQERKLMRDWKEQVGYGDNPHRIFDFWGKKPN